MELGILEALDARHFVAIRSIPGGPAPKAVQAEIEIARAEIDAASRWVNDKREQERAFPKKIEKAKRDLLNSDN